MKNTKKALRFLPDGSSIWICEYKNCRNDSKEGYISCEKHIGQNKKDYDRNHITIGNMIFKADIKTAALFNK